MEKTTTAPPKPGRFGREPAKPIEPIEAVEAARPPTPLADLRTIQRRWPRTVPEKRVFPRG